MKNARANIASLQHGLEPSLRALCTLKRTVAIAPDEKPPPARDSAPFGATLAALGAIPLRALWSFSH
jgi:hypothetical protein